MRSRGWRRLVAVAGFVALAGCATGGVEVAKAPDVTGSLRLGGPAFGELELTPVGCASGERELFLGADFTTPGSPVVTRLAVDPLQGPGVLVFDREARFERALRMRATDCRAFRFSIARTGWRINEIYALRVELELDCELDGGNTVKGTLASASCW